MGLCIRPCTRVPPRICGWLRVICFPCASMLEHRACHAGSSLLERARLAGSHYWRNLSPCSLKRLDLFCFNRSCALVLCARPPFSLAGMPVGIAAWLVLMTKFCNCLLRADTCTIESKHMPVRQAFRFGQGILSIFYWMTEGALLAPLQCSHVPSMLACVPALSLV